MFENKNVINLSLQVGIVLKWKEVFFSWRIIKYKLFRDFAWVLRVKRRRTFFDPSSQIQLNFNFPIKFICLREYFVEMAGYIELLFKPLERITNSNNKFWMSALVMGQRINIHGKFTLENNFHHFMSQSRPILIISAISHSLKITNYGENCHSQISHLMQMMKSEMTFTLNSRKFWLLPITSLHLTSDAR